MAVYVDGETKLTYKEHRLYPDDGRRHETIDGEHYVSPSPNTSHQSASKHIGFSLYEQIERPGSGYVFYAPFDVELSEVDIVEPDIIVVLNENRRIILPSRVRGIPDLVVEILSPSNSDYDKELKRSLYERRGVPVYWIVDVEAATVTSFTLEEDGRYGEPSVHNDRIEFAGATVDLSEVWELMRR